MKIKKYKVYYKKDVFQKLVALKKELEKKERGLMRRR